MVRVHGAQAVVGWKTVVQAGVEVVYEVRLTCMHWHPLRTPKPLGNCPRTWQDRSYRCRPCGSLPGLQASVDGMRYEQAVNQEAEQGQHLREVLPEVVSDPVRATAMVLFIEAALEARALPVRDRRQEELNERINRQALLAGLLPSHRPEDDWGHRA